MTNEEFAELRLWLRENAKNVKMFVVDKTFTGRITTFEGEERTESLFESIQALKDYYGRQSTGTSEGTAKTKRGLFEKIVGAVKSSLER